MRVEELTPPSWQALEANALLTTVFHDARWLSTVKECIGGKLTLYLCNGASGAWLAPCYTGPMWSRDGFRVGGIGYGGPIPLTPSSEEHWLHSCCDVVAAISQHRSEICAGATTFPHPLWTRQFALAGLRSTLDFTTIINLAGGLDHIFEHTISGNKRTAIRRAQRLGVECRPLALADTEAAHTLLAATQARVGASYTTPFELIRRMLADGLTNAHAAMYHGQIIAVAFTLIRGRDAFLLFHGWDREKGTNANELVYWEAIQLAVRRGAENFDLGRSHSPNLQASKLRWGAKLTPVLSLSTIAPDGN